MRQRHYDRLRAALAHMPYRPALRIMRTLSGSAATRRLLFPRTTKAVEDIYRNACGIPCDDRTTQLIIMSKALSRLQTRKIGEFSDLEFERYVRVNGLNIIQDLCASGRGMIIAGAHFTLIDQFRPVLNRLGISPDFLVRSKPDQAHDDRNIVIQDKGPLASLGEVRVILENGGQVFAFLDGRQGGSNVSHPFLGRPCHFKSGIFNIAQRLGVAIVPASIYMDIDGCIVVDFHPPLRVDDPDGPRDSLVANLVHDYVSTLEAAIRARPWSFDPQRLALVWADAPEENVDPLARPVQSC